jgi:hypothetical protein
VIAHRLPSREVVAFRSRIIDAITVDLDRFVYVNRDVVVGVCPVCDGALTVVFHGLAARADLRCHVGCDEVEVYDEIKKAARA